MTGQGRATTETDTGTISVEIRAVNHRGLKINLRTSDSLSGLGPKIETVLRRRIHRGSVSVNVNWSPLGNSVNPQTLERLTQYAESLVEVRRRLDCDGITIDLARLATLPELSGGVDRGQIEVDTADAVIATMDAAIDDFYRMRRDEGANMAVALASDLEVISVALKPIATLVPAVVAAHAERLESRINEVMASRGVTADSVDVIREVQIFADRSDVSEELTRLESHLKLFAATLKQASPENPVGRKLDFVIQEMLREANTIGSKSSHAEISTRVVEMKCAVERMRELIQNIE